MFEFKKAFTLAEMMVVMLILSIIMAAMAPVMTTRNKLDQSSPWQWATNGSDAYFGIGSSQTAMIGQQEVDANDEASRLIINAPEGRNHLLFKRDNTTLSKLLLGNSSIFFGTQNAGATLTSNSLGIGKNINSIGIASIGIGNDITASGNSSIAIGDSVYSTGGNSITLGYHTSGAPNSVVIGSELSSSASNTIAIGGNTTLSANSIGAISLGNPANAGRNSIAIGNATNAVSTENTSSSIAIGNSARASANNSIVIGQSSTSGTSSIVLGNSNTVSGNKSIGLGQGITITNSGNANAYGSIGIGNGFTTTMDNSIVIGMPANSNTAPSAAPSGVAVGSGAQAGLNAVSLGDRTVSANQSVAVGVNANAKGQNSIAIGHNSISNYNSDFGPVSVGYGTEAYGASAIAMGVNSIAGQDDVSYIVPIAIGLGTKAQASQSLAMGYYTVATGQSAIAIGSNAKAAGQNNIAIGNNACSNVTGSNVVCLGANSGPGIGYLQSEPNVVYIGNEDSTVYIAGKLVVRKNVLLNGEEGAVVLRPANARNEWAVIRKGDNDGEDDNLRGYPTDVSGDTWWYEKFSDRRLKYVGSENTSGLDKIKQLKVFNYTFKKDEKKTPHVGVIAQDLQKIFPDAVSKAKDGFLRIRMEDMFYAMINAIKELDSRITALEKENQQLKEQSNDLKEILKRVQDDNRRLEARLKALEAKVK